MHAVVFAPGLTDRFTYGYESDSNLLARLTAPQYTVAYTYESNSNVMKMIDNKTLGGTTSVSSYSYTHDSIETAAAYNPSYSYDKIGNRKTSTGIESVTYTANTLNQYADIQVSSLSSQPFYDLDGNLTGDGG